MPEAPWGTHTRWLTCITVNPDEFGATCDDLRLALEAANIEARPVWKPMHLQPVFADCPIIGGDVAEQLFAEGLCLPSGSNLTADELSRVVDVIYATQPNHALTIDLVPTAWLSRPTLSAMPSSAKRAADALMGNGVTVNG